MSPFADNLRALQERSPEAARRVRDIGETGEFRQGWASDGAAIVECNGRPLESRRSPADAARRQAEGVGSAPLSIAGFGAGYLAEALLESGREVGAIVDSCPAALAAAMHARDLRHVLRRVRVVFADGLRDLVELVCLKARTPLIVPLAGCVAADPSLQAIVQLWPRVPAPSSRPPRVLVVGPILGGSLETARSTAVATRETGADTTFIDFAPFAPGWEMFSDMGLSALGLERVKSEYSDALGRAVVERAAAWQPDLVLALAQAPLAPRQLDALRAGGARTAFWFVENGRVLPYWKLVAPAYDAFFAIQPEPFLEDLRRAGAPKAVYLPTACDASRHVPVALTPAEEKRFASTISFAGAPYLNRRRLLPAVSDLGLRVWGEGWGATELSPCAAEGGQRFDLSEMLRIFAGSKVNLNLHSARHVDGLDPDADYVNPRTFELAACGAFQVVDHREPLRELFAEDELVTFRSIPELRDLIVHYLARPDERRTIADRARVRALAGHTFHHRVRKIFRETLPAPLVAASLLGVKSETLDEAIARLSASPTMTTEEALLRSLKEAQVK